MTEKSIHIAAGTSIGFFISTIAVTLLDPSLAAPLLAVSGFAILAIAWGNSE